MRKTIKGVPRDAVAFAAGVRSATGRTWVEIACALSLLGWDGVSPAALGEAVLEFSMRRVDVALNKDGGRSVLVVRKDPSGGLTQ